MPVPIARRMQRAAAGGNLRQRRRGFPGTGIRNVTGGPKPPVPGQTPPILRPNQQPAPGPVLIPPAGGTNPLSPLAQMLQNGKLPDRFSNGFKLGANGKIIDTTVGDAGNLHDARYQKLYNAAQQAGLNITGGSGEGGSYNPNVIYARGGKHLGDMVDLRTGGVNPGNVGGAYAGGDSYLGQNALANLQQRSGFDPAQAAATAHSAAIGPGAVQGEFTNLGQDYVAPLATPTAKPQTQQQGPQPTVSSPKSAFENGKDPGKHAAYWADKGWHQNDATGVWHGPNGAQWDQTPNDTKPGQGPGKPNDPNGPQSPGAPQPGSPAQPGAPTSNQLPLDPLYEAQRQQAQAQFDRQMSAIQAAGLRLTNEQQVALARMATNEGVDVQQLMESLAGRGALQSSVYGDQRGLLATDYARQHQDLTTSIADALGGLSTQAGDVQSGYESDLLNALLGSASRSAADENAAVDQYGPMPTKKTKPRKRNRRRNR